MPINQQPIFILQGDPSSNNGVVSTANMATVALTATGDYTGVSTNHKLVFTADSTNGAFLHKLRFKAIGTNVVTVARIYINNGGSQIVAVNNSFFGEVTLPPSLSSTNGPSSSDIDVIMNLPLPPGFRVYVGLATTVAAGVSIFPFAGAY